MRFAICTIVFAPAAATGLFHGLYEDYAIDLVPNGSLPYRNVLSTVKYSVDISIELLVMHLRFYTNYTYIEQ